MEFILGAIIFSILVGVYVYCIKMQPEDTEIKDKYGRTVFFESDWDRPPPRR